MQQRAPEYAGTCLTPNIVYNAQPINSSMPYICTNVMDGTQTGDEACTLLVDFMLDCNALCVCSHPVANSSTLSSGCDSSNLSVPQICHCEACERVVPFNQDSSYGIIAELAQSTVRRRLLALEHEEQILVQDLEGKRSRGLLQVCTSHCALASQLSECPLQRSKQHRSPAEMPQQFELICRQALRKSS